MGGDVFEGRICKQGEGDDAAVGATCGENTGAKLELADQRGVPC